MARYIRTGFAGTVLVGPIVLAADATAATALTITQAQTRLSKNRGDPAQKHEATSASHNENGYYDVTLDATDTNTVGELRMMIVGTAALSYVVDFTVLSAAVYDWLFGTVAPSVAGDIMKVSSGTGANQISLSSGVAAASVAAVGTPVALDGGTATIAGMLTKLADDNGGATFDATASSQDKINTRLPAALTANGNIKASLMEILATALTETSGLISAAFKNFFNVATPTGTVNSLPAAAPTAGALITAGTGTAQLNVASGKAPATIASGDAVGLPAAAAGAKGGLPILDASTGLIVTGYGPAAATVLLPSGEHTNIVTDVGTALNTALPGSPTAASAASRLKALVDAAAGGTGGVSLVGSKMDMVDVPNVKALLRFWAGAAKVTISGDAKTITFLTAADATLGTLTTADGSTWTLTVS